MSAVWDKLFKIPAKKRQKGLEDNTSGKYINPLVKDIITCGEYDRLAQSKALRTSLMVERPPG